MLKNKIFLSIFFSFTLISNSFASDAKEQFRNLINEAITEAKESDDPVEKREILNEIFLKLDYAFEAARESDLVSEADLKGLELYSVKVKEKYDELNGLNGFERVPDQNLNDFANYSLQDFEQADTVLTISLTTLLLIIILAILIF